MNEVQRFFIEETRLGIPADFTNEGLRGVAAPNATSFPSESGLGHTWDTELVREVGRITGGEARAMGYTNIYAPTLDVTRDQRWVASKTPTARIHISHHDSALKW
jgi:beta-glucosidase